MANKSTTNQQQINTNKNVAKEWGQCKEGQNEKKKVTPSTSSKITDPVS